MKTVLLTGATGFIGYAVAHRLCREGVKPRLMVRRPLRGPLLAHLDAEFVQADLTSGKSLDRAVAGVDAVIHLAGRATFEQYDLLKPSIVDGAVALMRAAVNAGVGSFVFSSSLLVYGGGQDEVDMATPVKPLLDYGRAKVEAETQLSEIAAGSDTALASLRLPHIYGARDLLFANIRQGRNVSPGLGSNRFARMHVEDCAALLVAAAMQRWQGAAPVSDDYSATWNELFDVIRTYYPRFSEYRLPAELAIAGTYCLAALARLRRVPTVFTPDAVRGWNLDIPVKPGLVWSDLGLSLDYPTIHEGIPAVLDDCVALRWVHPVTDRCI
jgi:nucleoside-diphosphate-sugar epimerase